LLSDLSEVSASLLELLRCSLALAQPLLQEAASAAGSASASSSVSAAAAAVQGQLALCAGATLLQRAAAPCLELLAVLAAELLLLAGSAEEGEGVGRKPYLSPAALHAPPAVAPAAPGMPLSPLLSWPLCAEEEAEAAPSEEKRERPPPLSSRVIEERRMRTEAMPPTPPPPPCILVVLSSDLKASVL
jgi:hypothetical protein